MALDGLKIDGAGGVVGDVSLSESLGMSDQALDDLKLELNIVSRMLHDHEYDELRHTRAKIANILVTHLDHEERMCALHLFYQADVAPCSGEKLCRLQKRVQRKLRLVPELENLWHLL